MNQHARYFFLGGAGIFFTLLLLVGWEYLMLRRYAFSLLNAQEKYYSYIDNLKRVIKKQKLDNEVDEESLSECVISDEDEMTIDSFLVIDRTPEYLKESTISYLKNHQMDSVLNHINLHEYHNYTDQVLLGVAQPVIRNTLQKHSRRTPSYTTARWQKNKRSSETGIIFRLPIEHTKFWLSSFFGPRKKPSGKWGFHYGIDMAAQRGTPVKAAAAGIVEQAGYVSGYGNTIILSHDAIYKTRYAHLDAIHIKIGQKVILNQTIGTVGDTGFTRKTGKDASHLHFELSERGKQVNPLCLLTTSAQRMA